MNKKEAKAYVKSVIGVTMKGNDYAGLFRLRHKAVMLPEVGVDGSLRDESEWCFFEAAEKIDSHMYGCFYYFGKNT